jgi:hypothetical protein
MTHPQQQRPSNQALMTRALQICERLKHMYNGSDVTFVYEQLQHVQRYAALSAGAVPSHKEVTAPYDLTTGRVVLCSCPMVTGGHRALNYSCPIHGKQAAGAVPPSDLEFDMPLRNPRSFELTIPAAGAVPQQDIDRVCDALADAELPVCATHVDAEFVCPECFKEELRTVPQQEPQERRVGIPDRRIEFYQTRRRQEQPVRLTREQFDHIAAGRFTIVDGDTAWQPKS